MSKLPRIYAESTLKRMYAKLGLPNEAVELLHRYFDAFVNLYFVLPLKDAQYIINRYEPGLATQEQLLAFAEIARHEQHSYFVLGKETVFPGEAPDEPIDRQIIEQSLYYEVDAYCELLEDQKGKPLYIPKRSELLEYSDEWHYTPTAQSEAMLRFFMGEMKLNEEDARFAIEEIVMLTRMFHEPMNEILGVLETYGMYLSSAQFSRFEDLYCELRGNIRLPSNKGFTPRELVSMFSKNGKPSDARLGVQALRAFRGAAAPPKPTAAESKKVGRNDPCPCGSGRKYKKCCGAPGQGGSGSAE